MLKKLKVTLQIVTLLALFGAPVVIVSPVFAAPGDAATSDIDEVKGDPAAQGGNCRTLSNCDLIKNYVNPFIKFLSAAVGVAVVASIIIGGIQYGSSGGDSQKVTAAKNRIRNAMIALVTFIFLYALLNFLIPGGAF